MVGPLSGAGILILGTVCLLASSLAFCLKGMTQEMMLKLGGFVSTSSVGSSALQSFMLIHKEFSSPHCGALGAAWGVVSMKPQLVAAHIYNKVDRLWLQ